MVEGEISFGRFRLNIARRELRRDETLVRLGSRARDLLCVLGEADVPGISFAPRRPVVAEGIRAVKSGRGTTAGGYSGGRSVQLFLDFLRGGDRTPRRLAMPAIIAGRDARVTRRSGPICGGTPAAR